MAPPVLLRALLGLLVAVTVAACGASAPTGALVEPTLQLETEPGVGPVLAGPDGSPLYLFTSDARRGVTCRRACARTWVPFDLPDGASAQGGPGVGAALLGTTASPGGGRQVTYNRWPLYTYLGDRTTFSVNGEGAVSYGGVWWAVGANGAPAHPRP